MCTSDRKEREVKTENKKTENKKDDSDRNNPTSIEIIARENQNERKIEGKSSKMNEKVKGQVREE